VYECFDKQGKYRSLAGGGRYDELVTLLGGESTPATGFAIGLETLYLLLEDKQLLPAVTLGPDYYVAPVNETVIPKALEIAEALRKENTVDIDLQRRKLGKQFDYANSIKAKNIVIVGEKDLADGNVTIRELASGQEKKVPLNTILP